MNVGTEWLVDAEGCVPETLRDLAKVRSLCELVLTRLELRVVGDGQWHQFGGAAGVTGLYLLTESHLACHTYPEHGAVTINLHCCRERPEFPWQDEITKALGAKTVTVRKLARGTST